MFDSLKQWLEGAGSPHMEGLPKGVRVVIMRPSPDKNTPPTEIISIGGSKEHDPASLTKLMNLYMDLEAGNSAPQLVTISKHATLHPANKYETLKETDTISREDARKLMVTASDNRASMALAETREQPREASRKKDKTASDWHRDAVVKMNAKARDLGMKDTHFANASGMPVNPAIDQTKDPAKTTAHDMALLINALYRDFPKEAAHYLQPPHIEFAKTPKHKPLTINAHHGLNIPTDPSFLGSDMTVGAKTGFLRTSMFNIAGMITTSEGEKLIVVLLGVPQILRAKALTLVTTQDIPEKPKNPKVDPIYVEGNALRNALFKIIAHRWKQDTQAAKLAFCVDDIPQPASFAAAQPANLAVMELPKMKSDILEGTDFSIGDLAPIPASIIAKSNLCATR